MGGKKEEGIKEREKKGRETASRQRIGFWKHISSLIRFEAAGRRANVNRRADPKKRKAAPSKKGEEPMNGKERQEDSK